MVLWVGGAYAVMSLVAFAVYGIDKRRAVRGRRRIPERNLHLLELLGGWPGAAVGQALFRHKRRKLGYMTIFVGIVIMHLAAWETWYGWAR